MVGAASVSGGVVVVDVKRLLEESPLGLEKQETLRARYEDAKRAYEKLLEKGTTTQGQRRAQEAAEAFQNDAIAELEAVRAAFRTEVLAVAAPAIEAIRAAHQATVVVDRALTLAVGPGADVTDEVLNRLRG